MLRRLIIENFKSIGEKIEIDLKPITLLFGTNSAGKSSILQAFHLAQEVLEGRDPDVRRTELGGGYVDLGGFEAFVHGRDLSKTVTVGFENEWDSEFIYLGVDDFLVFFPLGYELRKRMFSYRILLSISWHSAQHNESRAFLSGVSFEVNDEIIGQYVATPSTNRLSFNLGHGIFKAATADVVPKLSKKWKLKGESWASNLAKHAHGRTAVGANSWIHGVIDGYTIKSRTFARGDAPIRLTAVESKRADHAAQQDRVLKRDSEDELNAIITVLLMEPLRHLRSTISNTIHLGPIRNIPARYDFGRESVDRRKILPWYDGTAAWELPNRTDRSGFARVFFPEMTFTNVFLAMGKLLDTDYQLVFRRWRLFDDNRQEVQDAKDDAKDNPDEGVAIPDPESFIGVIPIYDSIERMSKYDLRAKLYSIIHAIDILPVQGQVVIRDMKRGIDLAPQDVGAGISQVVPVLMAIFRIFIRTLLIEQPELHLHPRAQMALGDAMIAANNECSGKSGPLIVETHSEHLLLRILKRIRQTSEGKLKDSYLKLLPEQLSVVYVEKADVAAADPRAITRVHRLRVDERGEFIDRWPQGFFEERAEELFS